MLDAAAYFTTPHDYVIRWSGVPPQATRVLLHYKYRDISHCIDVTGKSYYVISDLSKAFPEYEIRLLAGDKDKLFFSAQRCWGPEDAVIASFKTTSTDVTPEVRQVLFSFQQGLGSSMSGTEFYLFPLKTQGARCSCVLERGTADPKCKICYGTGIVGGYDTPIPILGLVLARNIIDGYSINQPNRAVVEQTQIQLPYGWEVRRGDVLFDTYSRIGYMAASNTISMLGEKYPVIQTITVSPLMKGHILYDHPVIAHTVFEKRKKSHYIHNKLP